MIQLIDDVKQYYQYKSSVHFVMFSGGPKKQMRGGIQRESGPLPLDSEVFLFKSILKNLGGCRTIGSTLHYPY